jgi:hypothetical protein
MITRPGQSNNQEPWRNDQDIFFYHLKNIGIGVFFITNAYTGYNKNNAFYMTLRLVCLMWSSVTARRSISPLIKSCQ